MQRERETTWKGTYADPLSSFHVKALWHPDHHMQYVVPLPNAGVTLEKSPVAPLGITLGLEHNVGVTLVDLRIPLVYALTPGGS